MMDGLTNDGILKGIRILDFTWSVSGATATRMLAAFGAEVIKVEWPKNPDMMRFAMYAKDDVPGLDNGAFFNNLAASKRSITLNVKTERGMELVRELLKKSDVVAENFSAGVFESWGLNYETLNEISPGIVYMSISGFGHHGRDKMYRTWGPTAAALSGMTFTSGLPGKHPSGWGYSILDVTAGYTGAYSILTALYNKRKTGKGQYIDISQVDSALALTGASILDYTVNGRSSRRENFPSGNRSMIKMSDSNNYRGKVGAPHNSYKCAGGGENDWCTIAVFTDEEWNSLKTAMGSPSWACDEKFQTVQGRIAHQDELDCHLESFTLQYNKYEVMEKLQHFGVACAAIQMNEDLMETDPQLKERGLFETLYHPLLGARRFEGIPIKMTESIPKHQKAAPMMGEDNEYVFGQILGYSNDEIEQMEKQGVLWPTDMPRNAMKEVRALW